MNRTVYLSHLIEDGALGRLLNMWPEAGIETIEFGVGQNLDSREKSEKQYLERMGEWIRERPFSVHGPFLDLNPGSFDSLIAEATRTRFEQAYASAARLGADRIIFHTGFDPHTCYETGWPGQAVEFWKRFLEGTDGTIQIHLENVLDLHWEVVAYILDRTDCPWFTACLDMGHAGAYSLQKPEEWVRGLAGRISHLHLHDNDGTKDAHRPIGEGTISWERVFGAVGRCCRREISATVENLSEEDFRVSLDYLFTKNF